MGAAGMNVSWIPVIVIDIFGSFWVLVLAVWCAVLARRWAHKKQDDTFRNYIFLLTIAIVFFAISRSFGHLAKQLLLLNDLDNVWQSISPYCGASNSIAFVVIFAFGLYFQRFQNVHLQIEEYKNGLEEMVSLRTEELEEANITLENVLNGSNPLCIIGLDHTILKANSGYWNIWPGAEEESEKCSDSRPCSFCSTEDCPLQRVIAGADEVIQEVEVETNNNVKVFIVTARPFKDSSGTLLGVVKSFQDISKRKLTERALDAEREQLAVTLGSIGDGVITTDLKGNVVLINRITEQLTSWSQQEALGQPVERIFKVINEESGKRCKSPVAEVLASGLSVELATNAVLISRDNSRYSVEDSGAPIFNREGVIVGAVLVFRDVTEKRRAKEELFKVEKLESVGILAGGIAHDFNNILAAILGNIEMAGMLVGPDADASPLLTMAKKASLRAKDLTQQLLTFSKGGDPIKKTTSIAKTIREATSFILHGSVLSCEFSLPEDLWLVNIDSSQIAQVLQNLVINAKAVMPDGGRIKISGENVPTDSSHKPVWLDGDAYIKICVQDEGSGITEKNLEKIFDPYFTTKKEGSGLGLAITHSIIKNHHGHISVQSQPGVGTTFTIYLPVSDKELAQGQRQETASPKSQAATVIIMDDEEPVREIALLMLKKLGHEALEAEDGETLIDTYSRRKKNGKPIDIILMDLTIPGAMGGKEAMKTILALDPDARAIVSSGYSNDPVMADYKRYGFKAAVTKPFLLDELRHAIANVMDS
jgi:PAS domain S-box-containing protein